MRLLLISLAEGLIAVWTLNPFSRRFSRIFIIKNRVCIASVLSHQNGFPLISNSWLPFFSDYERAWWARREKNIKNIIKSWQVEKLETKLNDYFSKGREDAHTYKRHDILRERVLKRSLSCLANACLSSGPSELWLSNISCVIAT